MSGTQLATTDAVIALYSSSSLVIAARGSVPTPCHHVHIRVAPELILPPRYEVVMRRNSGFCAEVVTPYFSYERFFVTRPPAQVIVRTSEGVREVPVVEFELRVDGTPDGIEAGLIASSLIREQLDAASDEDCDTEPSAAGEAAEESLTELSLRVREAVGYSNSMSFDQAFADALTKLPPSNVGCCDMLETITVVSIGAEFGGIDGRARMFVRIRG